MKPHPEGPRGPITSGKMLLVLPVSILGHSSTRTQMALLIPVTASQLECSPGPVLMVASAE